jgi:hypothetical protein
VLLGNGDGTFQPQHTFAVGSYPNSVAVADINGDGIPDIVTANLGNNTVSVLLGNGDGSFQTQQVFPAGSSPASVAVADVDGDGKPDLIVTGSSVSVLLNPEGDFTGQIYAITPPPTNPGTGSLGSGSSGSSSGSSGSTSGSSGSTSGSSGSTSGSSGSSSGSSGSLNALAGSLPSSIGTAALSFGSTVVTLQTLAHPPSRFPAKIKAKGCKQGAGIRFRLTGRYRPG